MLAKLPSQDSFLELDLKNLNYLSQEKEQKKEFQEQSLVVDRFASVHGAKLSRSVNLDSTNASSVGVGSLDLEDSDTLSDPKVFPGSLLSLESGCFPSSESIQATSQLCTLCCQRPKDASFIHGRLGHQVSQLHLNIYR